LGKRFLENIDLPCL